MGMNPKHEKMVYGQMRTIEECYTIDAAVELLNALKKVRNHGSQTRTAKVIEIIKWLNDNPGKGCRCGCKKKPPYS